MTYPVVHGGTGFAIAHRRTDESSVVVSHPLSLSQLMQREHVRMVWQLGWLPLLVVRRWLNPLRYVWAK